MAETPKKHRLSFSVLLQSRKFLMIVSALLAIGVWWSVTSSSVEEVDRTITLPYSIDLSGSYGSQMGLRLVEDSSVDVTVVVKGPWSVISSLSADDLRVRADLSAVQKSGRQQVPLSVARNSAVIDYDIVSFYPASAEIWCDYWSSRNFQLETDISTLSVADKENTFLGTPVPDAAVAAGVVISGPKSEVDAIDRLVATVSEKAALTDTGVFSAAILAFDEDDRPVDISHCTFDKLTDHTVSLTVPVLVERTLSVQFDVAHAPSGLADKNNLISLAPHTLTLRGPEATLSALELTFGTIDFDALRPDAKGACKVTSTITLPDSVSLAEGETPDDRRIDVVATVYKTVATKTVIFSPDNGNLTFTGLSASQKATLSKNRYSVTLVGTEKELEELTADDLTGSVSLSEVANGSVDGVLRLSVSGADTVWVYYGDEGGIPVQATITNK